MVSGSYARTAEHNAKIAKATGRYWSEHDDRNNKIRKGQKKFRDSPDFKLHHERLWETRRRLGKDKQSEETKQKIREKRKLQVITKKHKENISLGVSKASKHFTPMFFSIKLNHKVRSYLEEDMMVIAKKFNSDYIYEKRFKVIEDGVRHFYFLDQYFPKIRLAIEYKGFLQWRKVKKYKAFKEQYPEIRYVLVLQKDILKRAKQDLSFFDDIVTVDKFEKWCSKNLGGGDLYGRKENKNSVLSSLRAKTHRLLKSARCTSNSIDESRCIGETLVNQDNTEGTLKRDAVETERENPNRIKLQSVLTGDSKSQAEMT